MHLKEQPGGDSNAAIGGMSRCALGTTAGENPKPAIPTAGKQCGEGFSRTET